MEYEIQKLQDEKESKIKNIEMKYNNLIEEYESAIKVNLQLNEACFNCYGKGWYDLPDSSGNNDRNRQTCEKCKGTGKKER